MNMLWIIGPGIADISRCTHLLVILFIFLGVRIRSGSITSIPWTSVGAVRGARASIPTIGARSPPRPRPVPPDKMVTSKHRTTTQIHGNQTATYLDLDRRRRLLEKDRDLLGYRRRSERFRDRERERDRILRCEGLRDRVRRRVRTEPELALEIVESGESDLSGPPTFFFFTSDQR